MATELARLGLYVDSSGVVRATKELQKLEREGKQAERQSDKLKRSFGGLKTAALAVGSAIAAIGLTRLVSNVADAGLALDAINSSLKVATGSAEDAAAEFAFLREESERLGLDLRASAGAFASLAAAAKGTALEGQGARDIFVAVSEAMTALGRSSVETEGALTAIEQMISKGNVSAEELRGQLGERLPGAFQIAARSIGVTTQELDKMLRNGELLAEYLLPAMAQELRGTFTAEAERRANGLQAEINRFKTAVFELMSSGNMDGMANAVGDMTELVSDPNFQQGFSAFVGGIIQLAEWGGKAASAIGQAATATGEFFGEIFTTDLSEKIDEKAAQLRNAERLLRRRDSDGNRDRVERLRQELEQLQAMADATEQLARQASDRSMTNLAARFLPTLPNIEAASGGSSSTSSQVQEDDFGPTLRIPESTITTVDLIAERYQELEAIAAGVNQELRTPQEIYQQEIELLNELKDTRKQGTDEGLIDYQTYARGVAEAQQRLADSTQESTDQMSEFSKQAARNMQDSFADFLFDPFEEGLGGMAKGFLDTMRRMAAEAAASEIFSAVGSGLSGSSNAFLSGIGNFLSFDGGGYTGNGPRSGGLDGKGGQLAMLHPQETVIDHTKGQSSAVSVSVNVDARGSQVSGDDEQGRQLGALVASTVRGVIIDERRPGGLLGK